MVWAYYMCGGGGLKCIYHRIRRSVPRRPNKGVAAIVIKLQSKRVHDKGCGEVASQTRRRSLGKANNEQGKQERGRGNKGKSRAEEGMVVEKEGEGTGDVVVRHRYTLKAVRTLNCELEEC